MAKILLVDDSPILLKIGKSLLEKDKHVVTIAHDGREAVDQARAEKPDIIFMDAEMPGTDGRTACAEIKKDPLTRHIPVYICTGHDMGGEQEKAFRAAGADGCIQKPYKTEDMAPFIQKAAKNRT